jgi:hypothetical protein
MLSVIRMSRPETSANTLYVIVSVKVNFSTTCPEAVFDFYALFKINSHKAVCEWKRVISWRKLWLWGRLSL